MALICAWPDGKTTDNENGDMVLSIHLCYCNFFNFLYFSAWLIDYFSFKGVMHLVFDRLDCNLHHILLKNSNKGLPLYIVKQCARHVLEALRFLAANMVVHGDVKMSNIMWNANRGLFQLVDFALSFEKENQVR